MQSMSDKEFDKLFQSRFEDFEVNPSSSVWSSIEEQLDGKPKRRSFPVLWMAAASVTVLLGAGIWIMDPGEKVYLQGKEQMAASKPQPVVVQEEPSTEPLIPVIPKTVKAVQTAQRRSTMVRGAEKRDLLRSNTTQPNTTQPNETDEIPALPLTEAVLASGIHPEKEVDQTSSVKSEDVHDHTARGIVHSTVLAMMPEENNEVAEPLDQRRRIRSVGDIVNFVVAKVDQRDDKLIEMQEDDEGTRISGINLGLFKLKSKKK